MSDVARRRDAFGWALAVLAAALLLRLLAGGPTIATPLGAGDGAARALLGDSSFTIAGNISEPMSPGVMAPLDLELTNPYDLPMSVTGFRVTVQKVSAPNADGVHPCVVGDFAVDQVPTGLEVTVAAGATSTFSGLDLPPARWPQVGMLDRSVDQGGCKGASLTLGYAASGTLAG